MELHVHTQGHNVPTNIWMQLRDSINMINHANNVTMGC